MTYKNAFFKLINNGVTFFYRHIVSLQLFPQSPELALERFGACR